MLGVSREDVDRRIAELAARSRELLHPLQATRPRLAGYMERQMDFCAGFYGVTDDKVVTNAGFIVIAFFPIFVFVMSMLQRRLEKRKEARKAAEKALLGSAQWRGGW